MDVVNSARETKNPARCTMSVSATHTSGFNTGSDNQNKWLLFPLYSTCQHSPLKSGRGGDTRGLGSDGDMARPGPGGGVGPSAAELCAPGQPGQIFALLAWDQEPRPPSEFGGLGGEAFPHPLEEGLGLRLPEAPGAPSLSSRCAPRGRRPDQDLKGGVKKHCAGV